MLKNKRIEVVGCTASGKTTLCNTLMKLGYAVAYEPYEQNPFLLKYYAGNPCAFELQMSFLLQHYNAIKGQCQYEQYACDFSLPLDLLYAHILLNQQEYNVYKQTYDYLINCLERPYCTIKLCCPNEVILERIKKRNRQFENTTSIDFIKKLNTEVNNFNTENCIEIDTSIIDISKTDDVIKHLLKHL